MEVFKFLRNCLHFLYEMATMNTQKLQTLLREREERISELEAQLRHRDEEILELRSHLDKFQSVFPFSMSPNHNNNHLNGIARPRKQRAQGISAEPQMLSTIQELNKFPTVPKNDRYGDFSFMFY
ncbi:uncharacterized protein LOC142318160 isoform X2 [Lycorma delicatula]|uniref:uncharacterized protein LOC142318160 isoform X2 n=1 Tax=Lycorma delicatula TaxID=130591 RepID=UPI003F514929